MTHQFPAQAQVPGQFPAQFPAPGPAPVRIGLGRSNVSATLLMVAFLGVIVFVAGRGAFDTGVSSGSRVLSGAIGVAFAVPLVLVLALLRRSLSPRCVIVSPTGLSIEAYRQRIDLAWPDLVAVGIGYELAAEEAAKPNRSLQDVTDHLKEIVSDKALEAMQLSDKRRLKLEIFPVRPDLATRYPRLKPFWKPLPPPMAGLPDFGWRFPLPPVTSIAEQIAVASRNQAPRHWAGWFPRPWSGAKS